MSRRHHGRSRHGRNRGPDAPDTPAQTQDRPAAVEHVEEAGPALQPTLTAAPTPRPQPPHPPLNGSGHDPAPPSELNGGSGANGRSGCTAPQLRRFIKSRPYVPMHELRRRFGINGAEDDVTPLPIDEAQIYVGLPERECQLLGELVRGGEVGYELSLDPRTPIVVGVYPMRPVPRA